VELDLSIVIPSYCRPDLLAACLASVFRHAPPRTEIIVVDDGSIERAVTRTAHGFCGVRIVRLPRRQGFCVAANQGIAEARGRIIELLNDDTEILPGWADAALACFEDPGVGAVAPLVLLSAASRNASPRIDSAGDCYYLGGVARKRGHGRALSPQYLRPCRVFGASASSAFYRLDLLRQIGPLPESFGAYFEDVDLSFRIHQAGFHVYFEPRSRVLHRMASSHGRRARRLLEQQSLNEERVFWRNLPGSWLPRAVPRHLAVLAAKSWKRWEEGTLTPFLCGRLRILREIAALRRHRRSLPPANLEEWQVEERWRDEPATSPGVPCTHREWPA
jgi:GT2 family glycosyltransferase